MGSPNPIIDKVCNAASLASPPGIALQVLQLSRQPDTTIEQLLHVIEADGALVARLLALVNSSLFGVSRRIASLRQAVVNLGSRTVQTMALTYALVDMVQRDANDGERFDYPRYWRRGLTTAVFARLLAQVACRHLAEEAFIAGLLADLGVVAAWRNAPVEYQPVWRRWEREGGELVEIERAELDVSHADLSAALLERWGLPEHLCDAVRAHHDTTTHASSDRAMLLTSFVQSAAAFAALTCEEKPLEALEETEQRCARWFSLSAEQIRGLIDQVHALVAETAQSLSLPLADAVNLSEVRDQAAQEIARVSMSLAGDADPDASANADDAGDPIASAPPGRAGHPSDEADPNVGLPAPIRASRNLPKPGGSWFSRLLGTPDAPPRRGG